MKDQWYETFRKVLLILGDISLEISKIRLERDDFEYENEEDEWSETIKIENFDSKTTLVLEILRLWESIPLPKKLPKMDYSIGLFDDFTDVVVLKKESAKKKSTTDVVRDVIEYSNFYLDAVFRIRNNLKSLGLTLTDDSTSISCSELL